MEKIWKKKNNPRFVYENYITPPYIHLFFEKNERIFMSFHTKFDLMNRIKQINNDTKPNNQPNNQTTKQPTQSTKQTSTESEKGGGGEESFLHFFLEFFNNSSNLFKIKWEKIFFMLFYLKLGRRWKFSFDLLSNLSELCKNWGRIKTPSKSKKDLFKQVFFCSPKIRWE